MLSFGNIRQVLALALAGLACLIGAQTASAQEAYGPRIVHLSVVDRETGQVARVYYHNRRYFVAAQTGNRYSLRLQNVTNERVLVVLSVDGVNVVTGETADFNQRGYILSPHESADINGWRKSQTEIAAFRFAPLPQSYAARTGRPGDVGVIGMAVFRERRPPPPPRVLSEDRRYRGSPPPPPPPPPAPMTGAAGSSSAARDAAAPGEANQAIARRSEKLGTAHGEIEHDAIELAPFEKASTRPESVRMVEYDSTANLVAAGVIPAFVEPPHPPRPFPANRGGYVPDPPPYGRN